MQNVEKNVNMADIVKSLSTQTKALNKQTKALVDNTLSKDCKSVLYSRINATDLEVDKMKQTLYSEEPSRPGLTKQFDIFKIKLDGIPITINHLLDGSKKEMLEILTPIKNSVEAIENRNLKKDTINDLKSKIPNIIINAITTFSTIVATYFMFR